MDFLKYYNDIYYKAECGCEVSVFDTERFTYLLSYCKGQETPKEHMEMMEKFVKTDLMQQTRTNNLMSHLNA